MRPSSSMGPTDMHSFSQAWRHASLDDDKADIAHLYPLLCQAVKGAGGLIQQQDPGVLQDGTRKRHPLLLACTTHMPHVSLLQDKFTACGAACCNGLITVQICRTYEPVGLHGSPPPCCQ